MPQGRHRANHIAASNYLIQLEMNEIGGVAHARGIRRKRAEAFNDSNTMNRLVLEKASCILSL